MHKSELAIGRYIQSDPIGLDAGLSTFSYVDSNPFLYKDYYGLFRNPFDIYDTAKQEAIDKYPSNPALRDAYRHCLASCLMAKENRGATAIFAGIINEKKGDWRQRQKSGDKEMDNWNNACGIGAADSNSEIPCSDQCQQMLDSGTLDTKGYGEGRRYW